MSIHLHKPIDIYFASENTHDTTLLDQCFTADAVVRDEGKTIKGFVAIKAWRIETGKKYDHKVEPLAMVGAGGEGRCDRQGLRQLPRQSRYTGSRLPNRGRQDRLAGDPLMSGDSN